MLNLLCHVIIFEGGGRSHCLTVVLRTRLVVHRCAGCHNKSYPDLITLQVGYNRNKCESCFCCLYQHPLKNF